MTWLLDNKVRADNHEWLEARLLIFKKRERKDRVTTIFCSVTNKILSGFLPWERAIRPEYEECDDRCDCWLFPWRKYAPTGEEIMRRDFNDEVI
ncbi:MAG: hypothetical protein MMC23_008398 [Stictis urceolatum]|nr:hypothetical protein [Stictis urceolata]